MFVANGEKQREKMTAEFYMNYKRDIETYEERIQHFIDNGCSSVAVINRWLKKIEALKAKKATYEQVLKRRLDDLDKDFRCCKCSRRNCHSEPLRTKWKCR